MPSDAEMHALQQQVQKRVAQGEVLPGRVRLDAQMQAQVYAYQQGQKRLWFHAQPVATQRRIRTRLYVKRLGVPFLAIIAYGAVLAYLANIHPSWAHEVTWPVRLFTYLGFYPFLRSWWRRNGPWW